jgi:hypothetical protein
MDPKAMPLDVKRMIYGGFKTIVEACSWDGFDAASQGILSPVRKK